MSETQERAHKGAHKSEAKAAVETAAPPATVTRKIWEMDVTLPLKFSEGHVLTARQSAVLNAAYERQFTNNMNANCKARAERFAAAKTDADKASNQPLTAAQIAALYTDYEPAVGDTPRQGSAEKLEYDARWNAYVSAVADHNKAVAAGKAGIFASAGPVKIAPLPSKKKDQSADAHKAELAEAQEKRRMFLEKFASMSKYAPRVEAERAKLAAQSGKADKVEATVAGEDIL